MAKGLRWTPKQLEDHTSGSGSAGGKAKVARSSTKKDRLMSAVESIKSAKLSGKFVRDEFIELNFEGAMTLSPNELYALNPFQRHKYIKAWHTAVHHAFLLVTNGPKNSPTLDKFEIGAHRQSRGKPDMDALSGFFKAPIDGLTHAGIIQDDNRECFVRYAYLRDTVGAPCLSLLVRRVES